MRVCKGDQGGHSGPRPLDVPGKVQLQQPLRNDIMICNLNIEDSLNNDEDDQDDDEDGSEDDDDLEDVLHEVGCNHCGEIPVQL